EAQEDRELYHGGEATAKRVYPPLLEEPHLLLPLPLRVVLEPLTNPLELGLQLLLCPHTANLSYGEGKQQKANYGGHDHDTRPPRQPQRVEEFQPVTKRA